MYEPDPFGANWAELLADGFGKTETGELFAGLFIRKEDVVVDVGCGAGGYINFAAEQGAHVVLVDVDPALVARAERLDGMKRARKVEILVSDCNPIPLADGYASVVICTEVLEHVPDPHALMAELARIGAPGARYMISVPDTIAEGWQKILAPPGYFEPPNHLRILGRDEFRTLVAAHGLAVESWHGRGFYHAVYWAMFWSCGVELGERHPVLDHWAQAWAALLATKDGPRVKAALDSSLPKSQIILARKGSKPVSALQAGAASGAGV